MSEPAPPFTLSRETDIRVDRDGAFWHEGTPVTHPGLRTALARWLDVDPESGRYILKNAVQWCFLQVDDAPLVVTSIVRAKDGITVHLTDDTTERLDAATLRIDAGDVPYATVRGGKLPARFARAAAYALLDGAREDAGHVVVDVGGRELAVPRVAKGAAR